MTEGQLVRLGELLAWMTPRARRARRRQRVESARTQRRATKAYRRSLSPLP